MNQVPAEIRTGHIENKSQKVYRLNKLVVSYNEPREMGEKKKKKNTYRRQQE
jgi:hypothetical protein